MIIVNRPQTDPYFNIAAEEYLLKKVDSNCFMLWQNQPCVIVGKHQNTLAEINLPFVTENNVPVIRRISGGGTVFHDLGNLNFSFIHKGEKDKLVDFRKYMDPIIEFINKLGVPASFEGKNDIRINGLKISGNAEHVYKQNVLHHGTLLYSSRLENLQNALRSNFHKFEDKAVHSVRSKVGNISDFMTRKMTLTEFRDKIIDYVSKKFSVTTFYEFTPMDITSINELVEQKYKTWAWNFGYSPDYIFRNTLEFNHIRYNVLLSIHKGIIHDLQMDVEPERKKIVIFFRDILVGSDYNYIEIRQKFEGFNNRLESYDLDVESALKIIF